MGSPWLNTYMNRGRPAVASLPRPAARALRRRGVRDASLGQANQALHQEP